MASVTTRLTVETNQPFVFARGCHCPSTDAGSPLLLVAFGGYPQNSLPMSCVTRGLGGGKIPDYQGKASSKKFDLGGTCV